MIRRMYPCLVALVFAGYAGSATAQNFTAAVAEWFASTQRAVSGLAVQTKQRSVSAEQVSSATQASFKGFARTIVAVEADMDTVAATNASADPLTSGGELCNATQVAASQTNAEDVADIITSGIAEAERVWREEGGDAAVNFSANLEMRQQVYCSAAEYERGLCGPNSGTYNESGEPPAADSNASEWLLVRSYGSGTAVNGANYIDTVTSFPTMFPPDAAAGDVDKQLRNLVAHQDMARLSIARGALGDVLARGLEGAE